jgi:hypothetical protein
MREIIGGGLIKLKRDGTIRLYYDDPLLENAEYLTSL